MSSLLTSHTIIKNEERWIKPALLSVIDHVSRMLVWDTGSTDKTVEVIKSINSPKIEFSQKGAVDRQGLVKLRNQQIRETKARWFLLVDGDEVWPEENLVQLIESIKKAKSGTIALVNRTRNCIGDIYHYQPEEKGHYRIGPWQGHLNIRAIKNNKDLQVVGEYPDEAYIINGKPLQKQVRKLEFVDTWYLHLTHLKRSGWKHQLSVIDRTKKTKLFGKRLTMSKADLPQVLFDPDD